MFCYWKRFPAIFATENENYRRVGENQRAYFGYIKDIVVQTDSVKIYYEKLFDFPQEILREHSVDFGLDNYEVDKNGNRIPELHKTHWAVKNRRLIESLMKYNVIHVKADNYKNADSNNANCEIQQFRQ